MVCVCLPNCLHKPVGLLEHLVSFQSLWPMVAKWTCLAAQGIPPPAKLPTGTFPPIAYGAGQTPSGYTDSGSSFAPDYTVSRHRCSRVICSEPV